MLHQKLQKISNKLDELALQKRLEIEAEHLKRIKCTRFIRLFCTVNGSCLKVHTNVLSEVGNDEKIGFWDIVKRFSVAINTEYVAVDKEHKLLPADQKSFAETEFSRPEIFEWTKESQTEGFVVPITGDCKKMQLLIKLANQRNVYKLSKGLAQLFNSYSDTKYQVIQEIYKYASANKLNNFATSNITCDAKLEKVFGVKEFNFSNVATLIEPHLEPLHHCCIDVSLDKNEIWDIEVETDDLTQMPVLYPSIVQSLEKKIEETRSLANKLKEKVLVLEEFCEDPALFINRRLALDSEAMGTKTAFYDNLNVQTGLFELIKRKDQ